MFLLLPVTASPVFAVSDFDRGSQGSLNRMPSGAVDHGASQDPKDDQNTKDSEILLNNCDRYIQRIYQRIQRLQMEIRNKHVSASVRDEIKKLEQALNEANNIARSLQLM